MNECDYLGRHPLFKELDHSTREILTQKCRRNSFEKGESVTLPGKIDSLVIIIKGRVKLSQYNPDGKEYIVDVLHDDDLIGEEIVLDPNSSTEVHAIALTPVSILLLDKEPLLEIIQSNPSLSLQLAGELGKKLEHAHYKGRLLSENDAIIRVAAFMLDRDTRCLGGQVSLGIDDIAALINLRRETVSRKLGELARMGVIERIGQNGIKVTDREKLSAIAES